MDTINMIIQAVSTVGFPIVAFFTAIMALKYAFDETNKKSDKAFSELSKLTEAINQNTVTLTRLCEKVDDIDDRK